MSFIALLTYFTVVVMILLLPVYKCENWHFEAKMCLSSKRNSGCIWVRLRLHEAMADKSTVSIQCKWTLYRLLVDRRGLG